MNEKDKQNYVPNIQIRQNTEGNQIKKDIENNVVFTLNNKFNSQQRCLLGENKESELTSNAKLDVKNEDHASSLFENNKNTLNPKTKNTRSMEYRNRTYRSSVHIEDIIVKKYISKYLEFRYLVKWSDMEETWEPMSVILSDSNEKILQMLK